MACFIQNQAAVRISAVLAVEGDENRVFVLRVAEVCQFEDGSLAFVLGATEHGRSVEVAGRVEHDSGRRIGAAFVGGEGIKNLFRPFSTFCTSQLVDGPMAISAARVGCSVEVSDRVERGSARCTSA